MDNEEQANNAVEKQGSRLKKLTIMVAVLAAVFLAGYGPSWWKAQSIESQRVLLEDQLNLARLHSLLGMMCFEANRNNYHSAAAYSNRFFDSLKNAVNGTDDAALKEKLRSVDANRDSITAYLAKADPAVKDILAQMYADFYQFAASGQ